MVIADRNSFKMGHMFFLCPITFKDIVYHLNKGSMFETDFDSIAKDDRVHFDIQDIGITIFDMTTDVIGEELVLDQRVKPISVGPVLHMRSVYILTLKT